MHTSLILDHADALARMDVSGGFTVDPVTGIHVDSGYAVALPPRFRGEDATDWLATERGALTPEQWDALVSLARANGACVGGWRAPDRDAYDLAIVVDTEADARRISALSGQDAIFVLDTGAEIYV